MPADSTFDAALAKARRALAELDSAAQGDPGASSAYVRTPIARARHELELAGERYGEDELGEDGSIDRRIVAHELEGGE